MKKEEEDRKDVFLICHGDCLYQFRHTLSSMTWVLVDKIQKTSNFALIKLNKKKTTRKFCHNHDDPVKTGMTNIYTPI